MKWKKQHNKPNCGQIALAVITNKPLREIYKIVGHDNYTKTKDLVKALRKLGYTCPSRLKTLKESPELAIAKVSHKLKYNWHWVVVDKDKIYDGVYGTSSGKVKWKRGHKITSYLCINK